MEEPKEGDSGCIVYDKTSKKLVGILSAKAKGSDTGKWYMIISSAELALKDLGASSNWIK